MPSNWTPEQIAAVVAALATLIAALAAVVSALFAWIAVRAHRAAQRPHVRVTHTNVMPVWGGTGRYLEGSTLGDLWLAIEVHNDGLVPVTVTSAGVEFGDGGTAPFVRPPWPGGDSLPKRLDPGEEVTLWIDEVPKVAQVHVEHGGAQCVYAKIGGGVEFHGKPIKKAWLDGWVPKI